LGRGFALNACLKNNYSFEFEEEGGMLVRYPRVSKVVTKILEIAGAACASALAAVLLGNAREHARPPEPPAVVRLAPGDEQMIRYVREEGAALVEQLRSASDTRSASTPAAAPGSAPPKPAKAAASAPARREQKANVAPAIEPKQRPTDPMPMQSLAVASDPARGPAPTPAAAERMPPPPSAAGETSWPSAQTQVPLRLWPAAAAGSLRDAPRPPLGVGEFLSSSM
jgi:hypothetical protein